MARISYAEMMIYNDRGESIGFELSPMQLWTVCQILGLKDEDGDEIACYSDETLQRFMGMEKNPLNIKIIRGKIDQNESK